MSGAVVVMVTWLQLTSLLLLCLLSELHYSSAFPRARNSVNPETWQGFGHKQQEKGFNSGIRRPLQHIQALRQAHRTLQSNTHGKTWQKPQGTSLNHPQSHNQPSLYRQAQNSKHSSQSQTPPLRNQPLARPRSFELSLKVPFASSPSKNQETSQTIKGSPGGSDGAFNYRPTSVQLHTSFNHPSGSDGQGVKGSTNDPYGAKHVKGSTNDPHGAKHVDQVSKPSFQLSLSVPIPATSQSPKPAGSIGGGFTNMKGPGAYEFVQNSYTQPTNPQFSSTHSDSGWMLLNSGGPLQQRTENQLHESAHGKHTDAKLVAFSPAYVSQPATPVYHYPQQSTNVYTGYHTPQVNYASMDYVKGQSGQTGSYNPTNVQFAYPQQSVDVYSGYHTPQVNYASTDYVKGQSGQTGSYPTKVQSASSQSQYEGAPSGNYYGGQVKPSGSDYGQHQTWQPVGSKHTSVPNGHWQKVETVSQSSQVHPSVVHSQYQPPYNQEISTTSTGYAQSHNGQTDFSSSYHYNKGQIRQDPSPNIDSTVFHSLPKVHDVSSHQSSMRLPIQDAVRQNPNYLKLFIDVDDVMDGGYGHNYLTSKPHYDTGLPSSQQASVVPTYQQSSGVPTYQQASGVPTYQQASGVPTTHQESGVPTYQQSSVVPTYQQSSGVPTYQQSSVVPTYQQASVVPTYQQASVVPTSQESSGMPTSQQSSGMPTSQQSSGVPTYQQSSGVPTYQQSSGVPTYQQESGVPTYQQASGVPTYQQSSGVPTYQQSSGVPTYQQASVVPTYQQASGVPTYHQEPGLLTSHYFPFFS